MSAPEVPSAPVRIVIPAPPRWLPLALAVTAGCLFLAVAASPPQGSQQAAFIDNPFAASIAPGVFMQKGIDGILGWSGWLYLLVPVAVTAIGLWLLRWWPSLLAAAGLLAVPGVIGDSGVTISYPLPVADVVAELPTAAYILAIIAMLACAQGLFRSSPAWSAVVVALALGARLMGSAMTAGMSWQPGSGNGNAASWQIMLLLVGLAALAPAVWRYRKGDSGAVGLPGGRSWRRVRLVVAGTLAVLVPVVLSLLTMQGMAGLLGTTLGVLWRHEDAYSDVIGVVAVVAVTLIALVAGLWALAGTLTASVAQVAAVLPAGVALGALANDDPLRWLAALAGVGCGAVIAGVRWRVPIAAALAVLTALILFIAYSATTGDIEKLVAQQVAIPSVLILILSAAVSGAITAATAPALAAAGALPAVVGPLVGVLAVGGLQAVQVTSEVGVTSQYDVIPAAFLFLVAGLAVSGLGLARLLAARSAERKHADQIRQESAAAERDRLGRSIHDGVLQVLALVQREGQDLGGHGSELAALAGEQEVALRALLASEASAVSAPAGAGGRAGARAAGGGGAAPGGKHATADLGPPLQALAGPAVEVAAPAQPVGLPPAVTDEVVAAVKAALDNVRKHAGTDARAWILLEDEPDGVRVTVRDDGVGFPPERPAEAAAAGRLGIAQSMRGRIADCGGTTTIDSRPGEGTEVEFWIPRAGWARR
jgi:signal transduction histidine kinase